MSPLTTAVPPRRAVSTLRGPGVLLDNLNVTTFTAEGRWYGPGA